MVDRGCVENGTIRFEGSVVLPEGAEIRVELAAPARQDSTQTLPSKRGCAIWADVRQEEWDRLPAYLTDNLDHYIYGTPR